MVLSIYSVAGGWFFQYIREPEVGSLNILGLVVGFFKIYGSRRLVLSIYTEPEVGSFNIYGSRRFGPFNIYGSRRLVLSIYTGAGGWFFQYIR